MAARKKLKSNRKSSKARASRPRRNYPENARITWIAEHQRKPTSVVGKTFKKFKTGMTVAKCIEAAPSVARSCLRIGVDSGVLKITR
jgi:hypothetical protein